MTIKKNSDKAQEFLNEPFHRELHTSSFSCVENYNDHELRQSIVQDILAMTMFEKEENETIVFNKAELVRHLVGHPSHRYGDVRQRTLVQLEHADIAHLIDRSNEELSIKNDRKILQAAMNYCGVYYDGFEMPDGVLIINREAISQAVAEHGGLDNFAKSLSMDMFSTTVQKPTQQ